MKSSYSLVFLALISFLNPAYSGGLDLIQDQVITPQMYDALLRAEEYSGEEDGYGIQLLSRTRTEDSLTQKQLVVLVGESHLKSKESAEVGKQIVEAFPWRGLEAPLPANSPYYFNLSLKLIQGARFLYQKCSSSFKFGSTIQNACTQEDSTAPSESEAREDSTAKPEPTKHLLYPPRFRAHQITLLQSLLKADLGAHLPPSIQAEYAGKTLKDLTPEERERFQFSPVKGVLKPISGQRLFEFQDDIAQGRMDRLYPLEPGIQMNFLLEHSHTPDFWEKMYHIRNIAYCAALTSAAIAYAPFPQIIFSPETSSFIGKASLSYLATTFTLRMTSHFYRQPEETLPPLLLPENGLNFARNKTMSRNIDQILRDYREIPVLLVLVGRAHIIGIRQHLIEDYGFTPEDLY